MENGKYYVPAIEEFHVGFEYERLIDNPDIEGNGWIKCVYPKDPFIGESISRVKNLTNIRVKYLDQEDIESLGWKYERTLHDVLRIFTIGRKTVDAIAAHFVLTLNTAKKFIVIEYTEEYLYTPTAEDSTTYRMFQGTIKNKSELKTLMKQLDI